MKKRKVKLIAEQINKIKESPFGYLFLLFWERNYKASHWDKLNDACIQLLMCFKEATDDEIKFEFVKDDVTYVLTSTPEEFSVITGMPFFEDRQRETKEAMYGGDFKESEFYIRNFGDRKSARKKEIEKAIFKLLGFQEDEEIDDELEETEDDEEEEMEQSPNLSEDDEDEEMEQSLSVSEDEEMEKSIIRRKN